MSSGPPQISASLLAADLGRLDDDVERAVRGGVDSMHVDVMDGHFVPTISVGPAAVAAVREHAPTLPLHSHLMISQPLRHIAAFAEAGSDLIAFHVESEDDPRVVIAAIRASGRRVGLALNPETPADVVLPLLVDLDLLLVMTVHPGRGGQAFLSTVLPKVRALRQAIDDRGLGVEIGIDGGVNLATIAAAYQAGGEVLVTGSALYRTTGELASTVRALRSAATGSA